MKRPWRRGLDAVRTGSRRLTAIQGRILLTVLYWTFFPLAALVNRRDPLRLRNRPEAGSNWTLRDGRPLSPESLRRMF